MKSPPRQTSTVLRHPKSKGPGSIATHPRCNSRDLQWVIFGYWYENTRESLRALKTASNPDDRRCYASLARQAAAQARQAYAKAMTKAA